MFAFPVIYGITASTERECTQPNASVMSDHNKPETFNYSLSLPEPRYQLGKLSDHYNQLQSKKTIPCPKNARPKPGINNVPPQFSPSADFRECRSASIAIAPRYAQDDQTVQETITLRFSQSIC